MAEAGRSPRRQKPPARSVVEKLELAEERRLSAERKHMESCGKQASSRKSTSPRWSIGFHTTQVYKTDIHRIPIDITDRRTKEQRLGPGPTHFDPAKPSATPTVVLAGWELTERFPHSRSTRRPLDGYTRTERLEKAHQLWTDAVFCGATAQVLASERRPFCCSGNKRTASSSRAF